MSDSVYPESLDNLDSATSVRVSPDLTSVLNNIEQTIGTTGDFHFDPAGTATMEVAVETARAETAESSLASAIGASATGISVVNVVLNAARPHPDTLKWGAARHSGGWRGDHHGRGPRSVGRTERKRERELRQRVLGPCRQRDLRRPRVYRMGEADRLSLCLDFRFSFCVRDGDREHGSP